MRARFGNKIKLLIIKYFNIISRYYVFIARSRLQWLTKTYVYERFFFFLNNFLIAGFIYRHTALVRHKLIDDFFFI